MKIFTMKTKDRVSVSLIKNLLLFTSCLLIMLNAALYGAATDLDSLPGHQLGILECRLRRMQCLATEASSDTLSAKRRMVFDTVFQDELSRLDTTSLFSNVAHTSLLTQTQAHNVKIMCQNHGIIVRRMMTQKGSENFCRMIMDNQNLDTASKYVMILREMQHHSTQAYSATASVDERSMLDCGLQTCKRFLFEYFSDLLTDEQKFALSTMNLHTSESAMSTLKELDSGYFSPAVLRSRL